MSDEHCTRKRENYPNPPEECGGRVWVVRSGDGAPIAKVCLKCNGKTVLRGGKWKEVKR